MASNHHHQSTTFTSSHQTSSQNTILNSLLVKCHIHPGEGVRTPLYKLHRYALPQWVWFWKWVYSDVDFKHFFWSESLKTEMDFTETGMGNYFLRLGLRWFSGKFHILAGNRVRVSRAGQHSPNKKGGGPLPPHIIAGTNTKQNPSFVCLHGCMGCQCWCRAPNLNFKHQKIKNAFKK